MSKTKILVVGIGGVGGYFGGLLAKQYRGSETVDINFLARGANLEEIRKNGLTVKKPGVEFNCRPDFITDNAAELEKMDYIILCTKSYDLESTLQKLSPCVNSNTIILPLLNGVDSRERISSILPDNIVLDGCVYIVTRLIQPGIVENASTIEKLFFGPSGDNKEELTRLEEIFKMAGINASLSDEISRIIWEKYIFIAPMATATSYFNSSIGGILKDDSKRKVLLQLIDEAVRVAGALTIPVPGNIAAQVLEKMESLPFETTSSMRTDFTSNKQQTELNSLTGYIVEKANDCKLKVNEFERLYTELLKVKKPAMN